MYDRPSCRFVAEFVGLNNILPATAGGGVVTVGGTGIAFSAPSGGRVASVALRPEVLRRAQGGDVSFAATVVDGVFFGDVVRYTARIGAEGPSVTFAEHRGGALAPLEPGGRRHARFQRRQGRAACRTDQSISTEEGET